MKLLDIGAALIRTNHARSLDETRANLIAFSFERANGFAAPLVVATDGHRLSVAYITGDRVLTAIPMPLAVRPKALKDPEYVARLLAKDAGVPFPSWSQVVPFPENQAACFIVDRKELLAAIKRAEVANAEETQRQRAPIEAQIAERKEAFKVAEKEERAVKRASKNPRHDPGVQAFTKIRLAIELDIKNLREALPEAIRTISLALAPNKKLVVSAHHVRQAVHAQATTEITVKDAVIRQPDIHQARLGFNQLYLLEAIQVMKGPAIRVAMDASGGPIRFDDESGFEVIMPVRL